MRNARKTRSANITNDGSNRPVLVASTSTVKSGQGTLRDIVKDALLKILNDDSANAAAKASASRTLLEYFADDNANDRTRRRGVDMTASELDAAIALLE